MFEFHVALIDAGNNRSDKLQIFLPFNSRKKRIRVMHHHAVVAADEPALEHRCPHIDIGLIQIKTIADGANGMSDVESEIP